MPGSPCGAQCSKVTGSSNFFIRLVCWRWWPTPAHVCIHAHAETAGSDRDGLAGGLGGGALPMPMMHAIGLLAEWAQLGLVRVVLVNFIIGKQEPLSASRMA